jgi:hypothetical protein
MSQTNRTVLYREAFDSATLQLDHLIQEMDRLKDRQDVVERAARALEPVLGSGAVYRQESNFPAAPDVNHTPYSDEEMDRRSSFALGRTAAD